MDDLIEIVESNEFKRNEMMYLFYCFTSQTVNSHLRVLNTLKEKIKNRNIFYYCISKLLVYEGETSGDDLDPDLYEFYYKSAAYGLLSTSPVTRTKCITVLSYLSKINAEVVLNILPSIEPLVHDFYWELKGQILILCANCLTKFNTMDEEATQEITNMEIGSGEIEENSQNIANVESPQEVEEDHKSQEVIEEVKEQPISTGPTPARISESPEREKENDEQPNENEEELKTGSQQDTMGRVLEEYTPLMFRMIEAIFRVEAPKATLKIGLIYLAKILNFYPEFTDLYLQILLSVPDSIRTSVVDCNPLPGTEEEVYVSGSSTEKYRTYGAPLEWNPLYIAQSLEKFIKESGLERFEWAYIEIFEACLKQDFFEEDVDKWLQIFSSLKKYFFISLCSREFSSTTIEILKKIYTNENMQQKFIEESRSIFVQTMKLIYQPDVEHECQQNVKEFLDYLHNCENSTPILKKMVYDVIKKFSEFNNEAFQKSNLIDLTVKVVDSKRGEIFRAS